jgi:uncharacterized protein YbjT (DUF2867 family)
MNVLVIGATGRTGRHALRQLVERGDVVTAFARTPSDIEWRHARLHVVQGDARDGDAIDRATAGQDAVLVAFGPRSLKKDDLQEAMMRNVVAAMRKHRVQRIVNVSAWGIDGDAPKPLFFKYVMEPLVLRNIFADKRRSEQLLTASGLEFVNVRPGRLLNTPRRGGVRASLDGRGLIPQMSREDLAWFMGQQLTQDTWVGLSPMIGY